MTEYDRLYAESSYMEEWPAWKLSRVVELVRASGLPERGSALDFGSGNGVFTELLRATLPGWTATGVEVSAAAVENARRRFPQCRFLTIKELRASRSRFDLVFSHHVLEHVEDLDQTVAEIAGWVAPEGRVIHILPCGNPGSLEHELCLLRPGGIDERGRFFFEDPTHLRRVTSADLVAIHRRAGLEPYRQEFANQHAGAENWITESSPALIMRIADPSAAKTAEGRARLAALRRRLLLLGLTRAPAHRIELIRRRSRRRLKHWLFLLLAAPLWPLSAGRNRALVEAARDEWERRRDDPAGSEMYLQFQPAGAAITSSSPAP